MRKYWTVILAVFMTAGLVSAQIWSETFSTNDLPVLNQDENAQITNEWPKSTWVHYGAEIYTVNTDGQLRLQVNQWAGDNHDGKTWGAGIALDSTALSGTGTYRLSVDIAAIQPDAFLGIRVWNADIGSGGTNNYYTIQNLTYANPGTPVRVTPTGDATTNLLADVELNGSHTGLRSVDFEYDGTGDVVVQLMAISKTKTTQRWVRIDEVSIDLASANPDVPSFIAATNSITPAAIENTPYTNDTFVASVTDNPGTEILTYSARWSGNGLNVSDDGIISGTPTKGGTNTFYISVADAGGAYDDAVFTLFVTNVNDAPTIPVNMNEQDALANLPYAADLSGYVSDEEGDAITFSGSGPGWLNIETNGVVSGTPSDSDFGDNAWEIIVNDGTDASTGTLHIAVQIKTIVHIEDFSSTVTANKTLPVYPTPELVTTTKTNGFWYDGGWHAGVNAGTLSLQRPSDRGGYTGASIVLDGTLFTDGAGQYTLNFDIAQAATSVKTYVELYDLDLTTGTVAVRGAMPWNQEKVFEDPDGTIPDPVAADGASFTLITNVTYAAGSLGTRTIEFAYDGTGDVLLRLAAGRNNNNTWWTNHRLDNIMILGADVATPYTVWASSHGLTGAAAASTNDVEPDGVINLLEYAFNGDPTSAASKGTFPSMGASLFDGSTNWIEIIHVERVGDDSISYTVQKMNDLVYGSWTDSTDMIVAGESPVVDNYKTVTNAVPTDGKTVEFLRVKIEK